MDDLGPISWLPAAAPPHEWEKLSIPWRSSLEKFAKFLVVHTLGLTVTPSTPCSCGTGATLSEADGGDRLVTGRWPGLGRAGRTCCHVPTTAHIAGGNEGRPPVFSCHKKPARLPPCAAATRKAHAVTFRGVRGSCASVSHSSSEPTESH